MVAVATKGNRPPHQRQHPDPGQLPTGGDDPDRVARPAV